MLNGFASRMNWKCCLPFTDITHEFLKLSAGIVRTLLLLLLLLRRILSLLCIAKRALVSLLQRVAESMVELISTKFLLSPYSGTQRYHSKTGFQEPNFSHPKMEILLATSLHAHQLDQSDLLF